MRELYLTAAALLCAGLLLMWVPELMERNEMSEAEDYERWAGDLPHPLDDPPVGWVLTEEDMEFTLDNSNEDTD